MIPDGIYDNEYNLRREWYKRGKVIRFVNYSLFERAPVLLPWGHFPQPSEESGVIKSVKRREKAMAHNEKQKVKVQQDLENRLLCVLLHSLFPDLVRTIGREG